MFGCHTAQRTSGDPRKNERLAPILVTNWARQGWKSCWLAVRQLHGQLEEASKQKQVNKTHSYRHV